MGAAGGLENIRYATESQLTTPLRKNGGNEMTKHKHYYAIRAYADGWKIESKP